MRYYITESSRNKKTGPMPVATSSRKTCPDACPLKNNGCYGDSMPLAGRWNEVTDGRRGYDIDELVSRMSVYVRPNALWRYAQAGDLPGENNHIDADDLNKIVAANKSRNGRGFTFTHKPVENNAHNAAAVAHANANGFTINLSADNLAEADRLAALNIGPVVTLAAHDAPEKFATPEGRKVVVCPAQSRDDVRCIDCGLCAMSNREAIIAFRAHANGWRKAEQVCAE